MMENNVTTIAMIVLSHKKRKQDAVKKHTQRKIARYGIESW